MDAAFEDFQRSCASKKRYRSPEAAGKGATSAKNRLRAAGEQVVELRAYPCGMCQGWHLTKESLADFVVRPGAL